MKKFVNLVALGALAASLVIATGCNKAEETKPAEAEAPKVVEETTSTTTTTTTMPATATTETATTASTATTTTTTTTAPATK